MKVDVHSSAQELDGMMANSEKARCPVERCGRVTPSQAGSVKLLGVCNEHVPSAEAKMCSELYRDVERSAEMTDPDSMYPELTGTSGPVTDCNTKYIHWRPHARRNMVPLDPDRFSINQDAMVRLIGWAGNMTLSNAFLQGTLVS